jgi:hypothetical protein
MKKIKWLIPALTILVLIACAKPPQAEIDAAKAAVAKAAQNADVVTYAPDSLKAARDALDKMQSALDAKQYDKTKAAAVEAVAAATKAEEDARANKEAVKTEASALIEAVKKALVDTDKTIQSAKKARGLKLDFKALDKDIADGKKSIADAAMDFESGSFLTARDKAKAVQTKLADDEKLVSDAVQALSKKK